MKKQFFFIFILIFSHIIYGAQQDSFLSIRLGGLPIESLKYFKNLYCNPSNIEVEKTGSSCYIEAIDFLYEFDIRYDRALCILNDISRPVKFFDQFNKRCKMAPCDAKVYERFMKQRIKLIDGRKKLEELETSFNEHGPEIIDIDLEYKAFFDCFIKQPINFQKEFVADILLNSKTLSPDDDYRP